MRLSGRRHGAAIEGAAVILESERRGNRDSPHSGEVPEVPVPHPDDAARIRKQGRKTSATVLARTIAGTLPVGSLHELRLAVEGVEILHHEVLNDRWATLIEPGMQTTVYIDPLDPERIALG
jgi:hypothetical protein